MNVDVSLRSFTEMKNTCRSLDVAQMVTFKGIIKILVVVLDLISHIVLNRNTNT